jgi:putative transposase
MMMQSVTIKQMPPAHDASNDGVIAPFEVPAEVSPALTYNTIIKIIPEGQQPSDVIALQSLSRANRGVVSARYAITEWVMAQPVSERKAISLLLAEAEAQVNGGPTMDWLPQRLLLSLKSASKKDQLLPTDKAIKSWLTKLRKAGGDPIALADKHTGRRRVPQPWDLRALQMYHIPSKPGFAHVAAWLAMEGFDAKDHQVRRFIQSMPGDYQEQSRWRMGAHFHALNIAPHKSRDRTVLHVGEVYEGDGHTIDVYLQHPSGSPRPYRLEITAWMDVRSRSIVSLGFSDSESALSTLSALSNALLLHDHAPTFVHIDKGAGFIAKLLNDKSVGYYEKFGMTTIEAIPGNAKGKGDIEGWFHWLRDYCDKRFGLDYTGHDQSPDSNRRITEMVKRGLRTLPTVDEYKTALLEAVMFYQQRPQKNIGNKSPQEIWDAGIGKHRNPLIVKQDAAIRVSAKRSIRRGRINMDNREYFHPDLMPYSIQGKKYEVEYDTYDDSFVWVYDEKGALVCEAPLLNKLDWLPQSRREEAAIKSQLSKRKRRQKQIDFDRLEATRHLDQTDTLEKLEAWGADDEEDFISADEPRLHIDITDDTIGE